MSLLDVRGLFVTDKKMDRRRRRINQRIQYSHDCGKSLFANIVALGAVNALTHCVSDEVLEKAVLNRVPKGTEEANKKALQAGKDLITKR